MGGEQHGVIPKNTTMKTSNIILLIIVAAVVAIVVYSTTGSDDDAYAAMISQERAERERYLRESGESPITDKKTFQGLKFFPPDPKFRVVADLTRIENGKTMKLATSNGSEENYVEYAYADFVIDGVACRLLILEMGGSENSGKLFLAFADETSANETYGGGRYLDVEKKPGASTITLDFNLAYNPYCAYNDSFVCPLPPRENLLKVAIKAGEKTYH